MKRGGRLVQQNKSRMKYCLGHHENKSAWSWLLEKKYQDSGVTQINVASFSPRVTDRVTVVPRQDTGQEVRGELGEGCIYYFGLASVYLIMSYAYSI